MSDIANYVLAKDAADYLAVSRSSFYRHVWKKLPRYKLTESTHVYKKCDLDAYAATQRVDAEQPIVA